MERDTFKTLAAGKYAMSNLEGTIDKDKMLAFVEGATYAFDLLKKGGVNGREAESGHTKQVDPSNAQETKGN